VHVGRALGCRRSSTATILISWGGRETSRGSRKRFGEEDQGGQGVLNPNVICAAMGNQAQSRRAWIGLSRPSRLVRAAWAKSGTHRQTTREGQSTSIISQATPLDRLNPPKKKIINKPYLRTSDRTTSRQRRAHPRMGQRGGFMTHGRAVNSEQH